MSEDLNDKTGEKPNIVMVLLDGLRADQLFHLPMLSEINKDGILFNDMTTASPYTLASLHSIFTGMYGSKNGVDGYYKLDKLKNNCKTLTEYLSERGYYSLGDQVKLTILPERGFDKYIAYNDEDNLDYDGPRKNLADRHIGILDDLKYNKSKDRPFFAFLDCGIMHTVAVKEIFKKYDDFSESYFSNYDDNKKSYIKRLSIVNDYLTDFWKYFKEELSEDTLLILFSDHGMSFGEKMGERAYGVYTYDYTIKVFSTFIHPLLPKKVTIEEMTETIDIMPTILDFLNIASDSNFKEMTGTSLLNSINHKSSFLGSFFSKKKNFTYSETGGLGGPWPSPDKANVKCIRNNKWKFIHNLTPNTFELYDLKKDTEEKENVVEYYPKIVASMKDTLLRVNEENER